MQFIHGTVNARIQEVKYLFIDGAYFREVVDTISKKYFNEEKIFIDFHKVSNGFRKTFYYDCLPPRKDDEKQDDYDQRILPQKELFNSLRNIPGFHVNEGIVLGEKGKNRQKKVDIMIAVEMLMHSFHKNMEEVTLLTGDLDFKPVVDALVRDGMYVILWYERTTTSKDLIHSADAASPIDIQRLYDWSDNDFQRKHKMPRAVSTSGHEGEIKDYKLEKKGKTERGDIIELYKKEADYCIVFPEKYNIGHKIYIKYGNLAFLELYVKDRFSDFQWDLS